MKRVYWILARWLRKLFHCKPKLNRTPVAFYRKGENGEWIQIPPSEPLICEEYHPTKEEIERFYKNK